MVLKLSTHTEKRWNICSKEKLSKPNISAHDFGIFWAKGKIANFGKKKLNFSHSVMLMKMCVEADVKESISDKIFTIFFY